ncbi:MAG: thiamine diphosphokinase [Pararhodobacter sp.]|nr:thiamine diphosphokinase [Pararhodobacter sp.]
MKSPVQPSPLDQLPVTLLGGGALAPGALERALARAPRLVAVDSGADRALARGLMPDLVIGDFDSISVSAQRAIAPERQRRRTGQDDTDFDKALTEITAPFMLAVGFTGARLDHTLAGVSTLLRNPAARLIVDSGDDLCFLCPPALRLALPPGTRVSLYPMRPMRCKSTGLRWPTDALWFDPFAMIGTSNESAAAEVTLAPERPAMLALLPSTMLDSVLAGLTAAPVWQDAGARR